MEYKYLLRDTPNGLLRDTPTGILANGNLNSAFRFLNEDGKYVEQPHYEAINFEYNQPFSFAFIFDIAVFTPFSVVVADKREFNNAPGMAAEGYGGGYSGDKPYFVLGGNATLGAVRQYDFFMMDAPLQLNKKNTVIVRKTPAYNTPDAYSSLVNGLPAEIISFSFWPFSQSIKSTLPLRLGATQGTDPHSNLNGHLYKIAIFNRVITDEEADFYYFSEGGLHPDIIADESCVLNLPFKEMFGPTVENQFGPDATLVNFTTAEKALGAQNRRKQPYNTALPYTI